MRLQIEVIEIQVQKTYSELDILNFFLNNINIIDGMIIKIIRIKAPDELYSFSI
jgi:hypothetical protein